MAKTATERKRLSRERSKLNLVHIDDWIELELANVIKALKVIYANKGSRFWGDIKKIVSDYRG